MTFVSTELQNFSPRQTHNNVSWIVVTPITEQFMIFQCRWRAIHKLQYQSCKGVAGELSKLLKLKKEICSRTTTWAEPFHVPVVNRTPPHHTPRKPKQQAAVQQWDRLWWGRRRELIKERFISEVLDSWIFFRKHSLYNHYMSVVPIRIILTSVTCK